MKLSKRVSIILTIIYFGIFIGIGMTLIFIQPFGDPPDEMARFLIPQYIATHGTIPNGYDESIRIFGYGFSYGFQPILPYMIQGYLLYICKFFVKAEYHYLIARFVDLGFGIITAYASLKLGKLWFEDDRFAWLFAAFVTFLPESIFMHTYINTDSCCMMSVSLMLLGLTMGLKDKFSLKASLIMSAGIICCALSYYNAYGYIVMCVLVFFASFIYKKDGKLQYDVKNAFRKAGMITLVVLAFSAWWFIRSAILYDGDMFGLKTRDVCASMYALPQFHPDSKVTWQSQGYSLIDMLIKSDFINLSYLTFVAAYRQTDIIAPRSVYALYKAFFVITLTGSIIGIFIKEKTSSNKALKIFININLFVCMVLPAILSAYYSYTSDYQPQGRYILPGLVPLGYFCIKGCQVLLKNKLSDRWIPEKVKTFIVAGLGLVMVFMLFSMIFASLIPFYANYMV